MGLKDILSGGVSDLVDSVGGVIDMFHTSDEEKHGMKLEAEKVITARMAIIEQSVQRRYEMVSETIKAEMASGDMFTKRARPSLVYFGMIVIFLNSLVLPWVAHFTGSSPPGIEMPEEFWWAWTGVVSLWVVGRSAEKSGIHNKAVKTLTGNDL